MSTYGRHFTRTVTVRAKGSLEGTKRKIAVAFPQPMFDEIEKLAAAQGIAFQEQVRRLCRPVMESKLRGSR